MSIPQIEGATFEREGNSNCWKGRYYFDRYCWLELMWENNGFFKSGIYKINKFVDNRGPLSHLKVEVDILLAKSYTIAQFQHTTEHYISAIKNIVKNYEYPTSIQILNEPIEVKTQPQTIQSTQIKSPAQKAYQKLLGV